MTISNISKFKFSLLASTIVTTVIAHWCTHAHRFTQELPSVVTSIFTKEYMLGPNHKHLHICKLPHSPSYIQHSQTEHKGNEHVAYCLTFRAFAIPSKMSCTTLPFSSLSVGFIHIFVALEYHQSYEKSLPIDLEKILDSPVEKLLICQNVHCSLSCRDGQSLATTTTSTL